MRPLRVLSIALFAAAALPGCTRSTGPDPAKPNAARAFDIRASCAAELKRTFECGDTFVPMIVDTRIKLDLPAGIAARGKDPAGRAELIATAHREFAVDKAPDKHREICERRQAIVDAMPPERLKAMQASMPICPTTADCQAFARCQQPILEKMIPIEAAARGRPARGGDVNSGDPRHHQGWTTYR
jgi:hypothetical protein